MVLFCKIYVFNKQNNIFLINSIILSDCFSIYGNINISNIINENQYFKKCNNIINKTNNELFTIENVKCNCLNNNELKNGFLNENESKNN